MSDAMNKLRWVAEGLDPRPGVRVAIDGFVRGWKAYQTESERFWKPVPFTQRAKFALIAYLCGMRQHHFVVVYDEHFNKAEVDEILAASTAHVGPIVVFRWPLQIQVQVNPEQIQQMQQQAQQTNGQHAPVTVPS